ncbi:hypothetical protein EDEG_01382 [Edhazardia aedis USNM 41457]|uniref:Uncharacterized protein n=1 Tax=Edhazardia aedis (strain USNM 41457) TaxID=1003232 RepID=J9DSR9_EDHAE|nr:hypothetical protein EDEG_01382 [Edhazardia aedis USNM 41457]|eukprot:EJW04367.1 hypothetical protein EDEG_01382 [Edhazardia aedis USNM 41457]
MILAILCIINEIRSECLMNVTIKSTGQNTNWYLAYDDEKGIEQTDGEDPSSIWVFKEKKTNDDKPIYSISPNGFPDRKLIYDENLNLKVTDSGDEEQWNLHHDQEKDITMLRKGDYCLTYEDDSFFMSECDPKKITQQFDIEVTLGEGCDDDDNKKNKRSNKVKKPNKDDKPKDDKEKSKEKDDKEKQKEKDDKEKSKEKDDKDKSKLKEDKPKEELGEEVGSVVVDSDNEEVPANENNDDPEDSHAEPVEVLSKDDNQTKHDKNLPKHRDAKTLSKKKKPRIVNRKIKMGTTPAIMKVPIKVHEVIKEVIVSVTESTTQTFTCFKRFVSTDTCTLTTTSTQVVVNTSLVEKVVTCTTSKNVIVPHTPVLIRDACPEDILKVKSPSRIPIAAITPNDIVGIDPSLPNNLIISTHNPSKRKHCSSSSSSSSEDSDSDLDSHKRHKKHKKKKGLFCDALKNIKTAFSNDTIDCALDNTIKYGLSGLPDFEQLNNSVNKLEKGIIQEGINVPQKLQKYSLQPSKKIVFKTDDCDVKKIEPKVVENKVTKIVTKGHDGNEKNFVVSRNPDVVKVVSNKPSEYISGGGVLVGPNGPIAVTNGNNVIAVGNGEIKKC